MLATRLKSLLALVLCLAAGARVHAQPLFAHAESIESAVANADLVFIATIEKVGPGDRTQGREVHEVTIVVEETIKQDLFGDEPYKRISIYIPASEAVLADWSKRSTRLLVAHAGETPKATLVIDLTAGKVEAMKADMTLLRKPDAVIEAARDAAKRMPASVRRVHTFRLAVPRELIGGTAWEPCYHTGGHLVLSVPVDEALQKRARDYLRSDSSRTRGEGARALRYFKSDENIARLKALLKDPGHTIRAKGSDPVAVEAFYGVRYEAYETLKAWGVSVEKPVLSEDAQR